LNFDHGISETMNTGGLPEDDWIDSKEKLEQMMDEYIHLGQKARDVRDVFEIRYQQTIDSHNDASMAIDDRWELCARVLSRHDVVEGLSSPW